RNAVEDYKILNKELKNYSQKLAELPQIIALTKCDLLKEQILKQKIENFKIEVTKILNKNREEKLQHTKNVVENEKVETVNENLVEIIPISAVTLYNIDKLKGLIWNKLKDLPQSDDIEVEEFDFDKRDKVSVEISQKTDGSFVLSGGYIDNLIRGVVLSDFVSFAYFQKRLKQDGVIDKLKEKGLKDGDTIHIKDIAFEYME
ncbi:MAG: Obg family GTPase CgtA, partial [Clostridia bacterium]|nr:Obg family GTPase CgtA [Clostridia bacterium]MDD4408220.1 Obg family GTPase CgtA [Clostridia bacterium]